MKLVLLDQLWVCVYSLKTYSICYTEAIQCEYQFMYRESQILIKIKAIMHAKGDHDTLVTLWQDVALYTRSPECPWPRS